MSTEEEGTEAKQYRQPEGGEQFMYADGPTDFEFRESFFKRLGAIKDDDLLRSPEAALLFPAHEFIDFTSVFGGETDAARRVARDGSYGKVIVEGALVRLAKWIRFFKELTPKIPLDMIGIPVVELHAPNVTGASLEYSESDSREAGFSLSVKVGGVGAGGSANGFVKRTTSVIVNGGRCQVMMADMQASIQFVQAPFTGEEFTILEIHGVGAMTYPVDYDRMDTVLGQTHYCREQGSYERTAKAIAKGRLLINKDYHSLRPDTPYGTGIEITRTHTYEIDLAVEGAMAVRPAPKPATVPVGASLKIRSQFVRSVSAKYNLQGGHEYFAMYKGRDMLPLWWPSRPKAGHSFTF